MKETTYQPRKQSVPNKHNNTKSFTCRKCGSAETFSKEENVQHLGSNVKVVTGYENFSIKMQDKIYSYQVEADDEIPIICQIIMILVESSILVHFNRIPSSTQLWK